MLQRQIDAARARLADIGRLLESVNPDTILERGYARVTARDGATVTTASAARSAAALTLVFQGKQSVDVKVERSGTRAYSPVKPEQPTLL
jgi:exodeoxyribonuclease VII large subunit